MMRLTLPTLFPLITMVDSPRHAEGAATVFHCQATVLVSRQEALRQLLWPASRNNLPLLKVPAPMKTQIPMAIQQRRTLLIATAMNPTPCS